MHKIDTHIQQKIINLIHVLLPEAKIYLFGSRARDAHTEYSDIDLALDIGVPIPQRVLGEIRSVLEATDIINSIDIVDVNGPISPTMREVILKEGILWKN